MEEVDLKLRREKLSPEGRKSLERERNLLMTKADNYGGIQLEIWVLGLSEGLPYIFSASELGSHFVPLRINTAEENLLPTPRDEVLLQGFK
ncbi:coiled-coil domain-containing protein 167 isoform X3 [Opisthocomus hoazin]